MMVDHSPLIEKWLLFESREESYQLEPTSDGGADWVRGSYYLNGPARFQRGDLSYNHWLDGDGLVRALHFSDDGVHYVSRFVRSRKLREEEEAGRPLFRTFGTAFPGDRLRRGVMLEPPVNVSVYPLGRRLLAFAEQSIPYELDPVTLETLGEFDFQGKLNEVSPFAAHAKFDPAAERMVNFGISFSASNPRLYIYEFSPEGELLGRRRFPVREPHTNHDFAITPNYACFFLSPLIMDFGRFWQEDASVMESLEWKPEKGSYIYLVPRVGTDAEPFEIGLDSGHCLHLINAFEEGSVLYLDIIEYGAPIYPEYQPVPDFYQAIELGRPVRYLIDLESKELKERTEMKYDRSPDFPSVANSRVGRRYEDFWMLGISAAGQPGRKFFDELAHGNWGVGEVNDVYRLPAGRYFGGEPVLIPNPREEGEGMIVLQIFDSAADTVEFALFDAMKVDRGPVVHLPLRHKTHPGFHACFEPAD